MVTTVMNNTDIGADLLAMFNNEMREVWLTYLKVKPGDNTWAGMDSYMGIHYVALDKTVEEGKKFGETVLQNGTEMAWQTYCNAQAGHIAGMGTTKRKMTDDGIWELFLANSMVPDVHATAFQAYLGNMEEYDVLPVQARITKLTPVLLTYLKTKAAAHAGTGMASAEPTGVHHGIKRYAESVGGAHFQRQRIMEPMPENRKHPESSTDYHAVPTTVDYLRCQDVGYQSDQERRP